MSSCLFWCVGFRGASAKFIEPIPSDNRARIGRSPWPDWRRPFDVPPRSREAEGVI